MCPNVSCTPLTLICPVTMQGKRWPAGGLALLTQPAAGFEGGSRLDRDVVADDAAAANFRFRPDRYATGENGLVDGGARSNAHVFPEHRFANGRVGTDAAALTENDVGPSRRP